MHPLPYGRSQEFLRSFIMPDTATNVDVTQYPGVDWDMCLDLTGNNERLAEDLLNMFAESLPEEMAILEQAFAQNDVDELKKQAHKMHGALCYCGIPDMKQTMLDLEKTSIVLIQSPAAENKKAVTDAYYKAKEQVDAFLAYLNG